MRKELILSALAMLLGMGGVQAQMVMDLQGPWDFALGDSAHYDDYVVLPGSQMTRVMRWISTRSGRARSMTRRISITRIWNPTEGRDR